VALAALVTIGPAAGMPLDSTQYSPEYASAPQAEQSQSGKLEDMGAAQLVEAEANNVQNTLRQAKAEIREMKSAQNNEEKKLAFVKEELSSLKGSTLTRLDAKAEGNSLQEFTEAAMSSEAKQLSDLGKAKVQVESLIVADGGKVEKKAAKKKAALGQDSPCSLDNECGAGATCEAGSCITKHQYLDFVERQKERKLGEVAPDEDAGPLKANEDAKEAGTVPALAQLASTNHLLLNRLHEADDEIQDALVTAKTHTNEKFRDMIDLEKKMQAFDPQSQLGESGNVEGAIDLMRQEADLLSKNSESTAANSDEDTGPLMPVADPLLDQDMHLLHGSHETKPQEAASSESAPVVNESPREDTPKAASNKDMKSTLASLVNDEASIEKDVETEAKTAKNILNSLS